MDSPQKFRTGSNNQMNRQGRALCRILSGQGWTAREIGGMVEISEKSVAKAIRNGYATKDNITDDRKFVSKELLRKYVRPSQRRTTVNLAISPCNSESEASQDEPQQPETASRRPSLRSYHQPTPVRLLTTKGRQHTTQKRVQFTTAAEDPACSGVRDFLSKLRFDLSDWYAEMKEKGLGTEEELLAISGWEEERLDRVFAKLLPTMPELHRYVLTEGVIDLAKNIGL